MTESQRYESLADAVIYKLGGEDNKTMTVRELCNAIRFGKKHPVKADIEACARVNQRIRISGSAVQLLPEDLK